MILCPYSVSGDVKRIFLKWREIEKYTLKSGLLQLLIQPLSLQKDFYNMCKPIGQMFEIKHILEY